MKRTMLLGAAALTIMFGAGAALADDHTYGGAQSTPPGWMSGVADQKLEAVDGSSLSLSSSEAGVLLIVTSPTGETQKNVYALMSDKLGTVSDGADGKHLIGYFRATDIGLEAQFADGHTEALTANAAGGISLKLTSAGTSAMCMAWYPQGHTFSDAERHAALAEYAQRLGLKDTKAPHAPSHSCDVTAPKLAAAYPPKAQMAANAKGLAPVVVRSSVVHAVDGAMSGAAVVASATPKAPPIVTMGPMVEPVSAQVPAQTVASVEPVQPGHGASDCLSVDNNGADLGFHNQCGFAVQFSYCLQKAEDPAVACDAGSRVGNVAANSFVPLLTGTNIKAADAEHDFRWVGCTGSATEVTAHLDKTDPPAGRCVRTTAS